MLAPLGKKELPPPPKFWQVLGPSFILLGLGLGSGELVLWPYLAANWGLGIIWGAVLGITFQFFMNMEIERYSLICGESIFVGLTRKVKWIPVWFILSTFIPWMWPGITAAAATVLGAVAGTGETKWLAIGLLVLMGAILSLGPVVYKTEVKLQTALIALGVPVVFGLAIYLAKPLDWGTLRAGLIGKGQGYWFLPAGIPVASFLGAVAYAGAGGDLYLAQSFYVKEKGYGMGKYSGRITSLLTGRKERISLTGVTFGDDRENLVRFRKWWKLVNWEHGLVFWATGAVTICMLSLLAYSTTFGRVGNLEGLSFLLAEARVIGAATWPVFGVGFLAVAGLMLFATHLTVLDATARILAENLVILSPLRFKITNLPAYFYGWLWAEIGLGVMIFVLGFTEPLELLVLGAVLNAGAMWVHTGLTLWLNLTLLPVKLRPGVVRVGVMGVAFVFFGGFSLFTLLAQLGWV